MRSGIILVLAIAFSAGCAAAQKPGIKGTLSEGLDENLARRQLIRADEETRRIDNSGFLYEDRQLEEYVNAVARNLRSPASGPAIVVKIIKNPYLNAIAFPNGKIYVHTAILAAMENEAQLAALLGHEVTHVINRHGAREMTKVKLRSESKARLNSWLGAFGESLGQLGILASVNGYSRELEFEADREGLAMMVRAGYDPLGALRLYELLQQDTAGEKKKVPFVYSSHPKIQERIKSYKKLIADVYGGKNGVTNAGEFGRRRIRLLLDNAVLDLKLGNFDAARRSIEKYVKWRPDDARAWFLFGETARGRGGAVGDQEAKINYRKAISLRKDYADPYRAIGMTAYKKGDKQEARMYLEQYLVLQPDASDRHYIKQYINECRQR